MAKKLWFVATGHGIKKAGPFVKRKDAESWLLEFPFKERINLFIHYESEEAAHDRP